MKNNTLDIDWLCPYCGKQTFVFVEAENSSDFYSDKMCEYCYKEINDTKLDNKIMEEASEYFVSQEEWYRE